MLLLGMRALRFPLPIAILAGVCVFLALESAPAQAEENSLSELKLNFDVRRAKSEKPLKELDALYRQQLEKLRNEVRKKGELERVMAVDAELQALTGANPEKTGTDFDDLKELRTIYTKAKSDRTLKAQQNLLPLVESQEKHLESLKISLTRNNRIEEAAKVQAELKAVVALGEQARKKIESLKQAGLGPSGNGNKLPASLKSGLVLHYDFEEKPADGIAKDRTDSELNSNIDGPLLREDQKRGAVFSFDGVNDRLVLIKPLPDLENFTVAVWVLYQSPGGRNGVILSDDDGAYGNDLFFALIDQSTIFLKADKGERNTLNSRVDIRKKILDQWHHLTWTVGRSRSAIYVGGKKMGSVDMPGGNMGFHNGFIGYGHDPAGTTYFRGSLDDFRMWNRELSSSEVEDLYEATR